MENSDKEVQSRFNAFRNSLNSFQKKSGFISDVPKEELDDLQIRLFQNMEQTKFKNSYLRWDAFDDLRLTQMCSLQVPIPVMSLELGRTEGAVQKRSEVLRREQFMGDVPGFLFELAEELKLDHKIVSEKVNDIFVTKKFSALKDEIAKNHLGAKSDFKIKPKKKKRKPGRPRKNEKRVEEVEAFDGFVIEEKKPKKPVGRPRKYRKAS